MTCNCRQAIMSLRAARDRAAMMMEKVTALAGIASENEDKAADAYDRAKRAAGLCGAYNCERDRLSGDGERLCGQCKAAAASLANVVTCSERGSR